MNSSPIKPVTRRQFVAGSLTALGVASFIDIPQFAKAEKPQNLTVQQIMDIILENIPGGRLQQTVDTLKSGTPDQPVSGIVSSMFATVEVIRKAIELKANFIIVHEPTFYNHLDETQWLGNDKVLDYKRGLLNDHKIAVWRFHDYWHRHSPDGIRIGVLTDLGWEKYYDEKYPGVITLPPISLKDMIAHVKKKLGIESVRFIGDQSQICKRVLLMPGASGGRSQIQQLQTAEPDLLICGELAEWETSEYIRDARAMGSNRALIVLGHAQSEEPGMKWLVQWLRPKVHGIKVTHIAANNPFTFA